jgi:hypothetical protein
MNLIGLIGSVATARHATAQQHLLIDERHPIGTYST